MKLPRDLRGRDFARELCRRWDYREINQEGSHIILQTESPSRQRISVPDHTPLRVGTLSSLLRLIAAHKGATREDILRSL